jgi:uncharacterized membrane protein YhaH (DUF805 family)
VKFLDGKLNRRNFIIRSFVLFLIFYFTLSAAWVSAFGDNGTGWATWQYVIYYAFWGILSLYSLAIIARRLRDTGLSTWFTLLFVPFFYVWPVLFFIPTGAWSAQPVRKGSKGA